MVHQITSYVFACFHFALVFIIQNAIGVKFLYQGVKLWLRLIIFLLPQAGFLLNYITSCSIGTQFVQRIKLLTINCSTLKETKHSPAGEGILMKYFLVIIIALACRDLPSLQLVFILSTACQNSKGASEFFSDRNCLNHWRWSASCRTSLKPLKEKRGRVKGAGPCSSSDELVTELTVISQ